MLAQAPGVGIRTGFLPKSRSPLDALDEAAPGPELESAGEGSGADQTPEGEGGGRGGKHAVGEAPRRCDEEGRRG